MIEPNLVLYFTGWHFQPTFLTFTSGSIRDHWPLLLIGHPFNSSQVIIVNLSLNMILIIIFIHINFFISPGWYQFDIFMHLKFCVFTSKLDSLAPLVSDPPWCNSTTLGQTWKKHILWTLKLLEYRFGKKKQKTPKLWQV